MSDDVLDLSNHDFPTFDPYCLRDAGVKRLLIGCWDLEDALSMTSRSRDVGITVEDLYGFQYFGLEYQSVEVGHALEVQRQLGHIQRTWIDAECSPPNEAPGVQPFERIAAVRSEATRIENAELAAAVYTYGPYWRSQMANTTEFSRLPLWFAAYGAGGDPIDPIRAVDFGGWTALAAHQYTSTVVVCGRRRDHNYWYLEDDMPDPRVDQLIALVAGNGYRAPDGTILTGVEAFAAAVADGSSLFLGLGNTQGALDLIRRSVMGELLTDAEKTQVLTLIDQVLAGARVVITPGGAS